MPFCPNPDCPPRARTGRSAEYKPGLTHCADCGTELVADDPRSRSVRASRPPMPAALARRLLATVGICLALYGLSWLPHPGLEPDGVAELTSGGEISRRHLGPLGLGVTPLLVGFVLVELFALIVPALRRRRLGDLTLRRGLTRAALITGGLWALASGIGQAMWMEGVGYQFSGGYGPSLVVDYGWAFRLETGLLMVTGGAWLEWLGMRLVPGSLTWLGLQAGMIALLAVPVATMFYWRRRKVLLEPDHRRFWWRARIASIGLLSGLALADYLFSAGGPFGLYVLWPGALTTVIVVALAADLWTEVRARWNAPGGADLEAVEIHQDLSDALASAKVSAELQPDTPVTVTGLRYRSLTYFFAPYAPIVLLGPPGTRAREPFPGGESLEDAELAEQFE